VNHSLYDYEPCYRSHVRDGEKSISIGWAMRADIRQRLMSGIASGKLDVEVAKALYPLVNNDPEAVLKVLDALGICKSFIRPWES
jgi:hypothetical protein